MVLYHDSTALYVDTWQVRVHQLIARGVAEVRRSKGLTQEQVAARFRSHGLLAWRKGTVGQLEAGLRKPRLEELLLMARALRVSVGDLFPGDDDERIELGEGAEVSPRWIREMLSGEFWRDEETRPLTEGPYEELPVIAYIGDPALQAEGQRLKSLVGPILRLAEQQAVAHTQADWDAMFRRSSDSERHAAERLDVEPAQLKLAARLLWDHQDFDEERDRRIGDIDALEPRSRQARRGLVTRDMLTELRAFLHEAYAEQGEQA